MNGRAFAPTPEQEAVICHEGSAFVRACPGAGKTRVMVERARRVLKSRHDGCGIALLSFTRAAVSGLEDGLRRESLLGSPVFPHFIGTFDSFIWQFIVAPFGIPGSQVIPRLVPDKGNRMVHPFKGAHALPLSCFDRVTGKIDAVAALEKGFNIAKKSPAHVKASETAALNIQRGFLERGELDFEDARALAVERLKDAKVAKRLAAAIAGRFCEIIIDEAQDCNQADLEIVKWLRDAGIPTKVICDPHQSIYEFRGGVTEHLFAFAKTFDEKDRLSMKGNFRSSTNICRSIVMLRAADHRDSVDEPLGDFKDEPAHIHILSYAGTSVPASIGAKYVELLDAQKIGVANAPVLAKTRNSGAHAVGQPVVDATRDPTFRLAEAVSNFYFAFDLGNQKAAIDEVHKIILELEGRLAGMSYHQFLAAHNLKPDEWRPRVLQLLRALRYDPKIFADADAWHDRAKELLAPRLPAGGLSISQRLRKNKDIAGVLAAAPSVCSPAKTIHSVKGLEFPAVCVVTTSQTIKRVLDFLETGAPADSAEAARELYVAASRAQRLLVIAAPKSQSTRFSLHLQKIGAQVTIVDI